MTKTPPAAVSAPTPLPQTNAESPNLQGLKAALSQADPVRQTERHIARQPSYASLPTTPLFKGLCMAWARGVQKEIPKEVMRAIDYIGRTAPWNASHDYPVEYVKNKIRHPQFGHMLLVVLMVWKSPKGSVDATSGDQQRLKATRDEWDTLAQLWVMLCTSDQGDTTGNARSVAMRFGKEPELRSLNFCQYYAAQGLPADVARIKLAQDVGLANTEIMRIVRKAVVSVLGKCRKPEAELLENLTTYTAIKLEAAGKKVVGLTVSIRFRQSRGGNLPAVMVSVHCAEGEGEGAGGKEGQAKNAAAVIIIDTKKDGSVSKPGVILDGEWPVVRMPSQADPWDIVRPAEDGGTNQQDNTTGEDPATAGVMVSGYEVGNDRNDGVH